ncbi:CMRF35-like molecule 6 isoform X2 [Bos indicus]|uniref:CMRF35-like molecule 6 isoform X2 n=1 Tax=Bos indicus TaxID=9915 RepID=A0ABM4R407_BOSIN
MNTHTVLSRLGPSLLRRHPLLCEEGTCPSSAFPGSEETFASCLHLLQPHGPLAGPTSLVFPALPRWTRSWLCFPGCFLLSGPSRVTGIMGGSLNMECRYQEEFIDDNKFWCTSRCLWKTVETRESAREVRRGCVSIRDHPASLTFTVTLESLREEDAGMYWCGIDVLSTFDPIFEVEVSVIPASGPERPTGSPGAPTTLAVPTWSTASAQETPDPGQAPRPPLGSAHFLLLVFLKVPLLLGMRGAALWVHRPRRS